jgi:hypothetical protein
MVGRFRLEIRSGGLLLQSPQRLDPGPQIRKVFVCPVYSLESAVERVLDHGTSV